MHKPAGETPVDGRWIFMTLVLPRCWVWNFSMKFSEENSSNYNKGASTDRGSAECWRAPRRTRANLIRAGSRGGELKQTPQKTVIPKMSLKDRQGSGKEEEKDTPGWGTDLNGISRERFVHTRFYPFKKSENVINLSADNYWMGALFWAITYLATRVWDVGVGFCYGFVLLWYNGGERRAAFASNKCENTGGGEK